MTAIRITEGCKDGLFERVNALLDAPGRTFWVHVVNDPVNDCDVFFCGDVLEDKDDKVVLSVAHNYGRDEAICTNFLKEDEQFEYIAKAITHRVQGLLKA